MREILTKQSNERESKSARDSPETIELIEIKVNEKLTKQSKERKFAWSVRITYEAIG